MTSLLPDVDVERFRRADPELFRTLVREHTAALLRWVRSWAEGPDEADETAIHGYPPPAQVAGVLLNSIFLDLLDNDALRLERLNQLLAMLPPEHRAGLEPVKLLVLRPSQDLGKLASQFEAQLPRSFRFLTRGLGTRETKSPDILSFVLFQPDYLRTLMEIGEADADARIEEIAHFLLPAEP